MNTDKRGIFCHRFTPMHSDKRGGIRGGMGWEEKRRHSHSSPIRVYPRSSVVKNSPPSLDPASDPNRIASRRGCGIACRDVIVD
jgi:hypothetical protein